MGADVGLVEGPEVGLVLGSTVGSKVGVSVGADVGLVEGKLVGAVLFIQIPVVVPVLTWKSEYSLKRKHSGVW